MKTLFEKGKKKITKKQIKKNHWIKSMHVKNFVKKYLREKNESFCE